MEKELEPHRRGVVLKREGVDRDPGAGAEPAFISRRRHGEHRVNEAVRAMASGVSRIPAPRFECNGKGFVRSVHENEVISALAVLSAEDSDACESVQSGTNPGHQPAG